MPESNFRFNPDAPLARVLYLADGRPSPETERANQALIHFYELGEERTTYKLYQFYQRCNAANPDHPDYDPEFKTPAVNTLNKWRHEFSWNKRMEVEDSLRTQRALQVSRERHMKKIEDLRQQCEDAGGQFLEASLAALTLLNDGIASIDASKMTFRDASSLISALNIGLNGAIDMKSRALGIEKLIQNLPDSNQD